MVSRQRVSPAVSSVVSSLGLSAVRPRRVWHGLVRTFEDCEAFDSLRPVMLLSEPLFFYRDGTPGIAGLCEGREISMTLREFLDAFEVDVDGASVGS